MFTLFGKKKLKEEIVANIFINSILDTVDNGFPEIVGLINEAPEFVQSPNLSEDDSEKFLLIVLAGNLKYIPKYFNNNADDRLIDIIMEKLSKIFNVDPVNLKKVIDDYQSYLSKVNHPSKNTLYGMSKAIFHKYELSKYQDDYFKNMKSPNPMFLKRLDEVIENFIWNWESFNEKYQVAV